jgi:hypothetical protein
MGLGKGRNCSETSSGSWAYSFNVAGVRHNGTVKGTEREAERFVREQRERIHGERAAALRASGGYGPRDMRFVDAVDRYWNEVGHKAKAATEDFTHFDRLVDWIGEDTPITHIGDDLVTRLIGRRSKMYRHNDPKLGLLSNSYVNRTVTDLLQRVLTRARQFWKVPLPDEPNWVELHLPETTRIREMTIEEQADLEVVARDDYWPAFEFALLTGLRKVNVCELNWSEIDWSDLGKLTFYL